MLLKFLQSIKMPDGYASHIKRCVVLDQCKISGLKTHDCHVIFQKLLPIALRKLLPENVVNPLLQLSKFFSDLCSKELSYEDLERLSKTIPETLCQLEMIFPPAFFDIMMHLPIHLAEEARLGGPVLYRWMYPIERYLRTLKGYVRNKAQPEGSIAEGYILEECMTFCSRFVDGMPTKLSQSERHEDGGIDQSPTGISIMSTVDYSKKGFVCESLSLAEINQMRHFIITNCEETAPWIDEHLEELTRNNSPNPKKQHKEEFVGWFERRITELHNDGKVSNLIYALAKGPDHLARVYNRTVLNGYFFRNSYIEQDLSTQNSGVIVKGDANTGNIDYYGVIKKIIFLDFPPDKEVVLFQCDWFDVPPANKTESKGYKKDKYGIIDLDTTLHQFQGDPYILGLQAQQVFYVRDVKNPHWATVIKMNPRNLFAPSVLNGVGLDEAVEADEGGDADVLDVVDAEITVPKITIPEEITSWCRNDDEGSNIDVSVIENIKPIEFEDVQFESDDDIDDDEAYVNDGHVAPLGQEELDDDQGFFV
ncbi:hypothetical protein ACQJBY_069003 [Aegilops geniculata]